MVTSNICPYHGLWLDDAPTKHIGVMPTSWVMMHVLDFIEIHQGHEKSAPLLTEDFCDFWACVEYWRKGRGEGKN
jgi:hypothetical protein